MFESIILLELNPDSNSYILNCTMYPSNNFQVSTRKGWLYHYQFRLLHAHCTDGGGQKNFFLCEKNVQLGFNRQLFGILKLNLKFSFALASVVQCASTYFVENKFDSIRVEESNTISQTGSRNSAESVKIIFFIHFGHGSGPFFWPRIPIKFCPFIKYTRPRKIIYRNI